MGAELVAGETEDCEGIGVFLGQGFVEGFEGGELGREAAFGGCVDDEDYFAFEAGEGEGFAGFCFSELVLFW